MNQLLNNKKLQQVLEKDGYTIIDFLNEYEIKTLLDLYHELPHEIKSSFGASLMSQNINYRQLVNQKIKKILGEKTEKLFGFHRLSFWGFVFKKCKAIDSEVPIHQDPSFIDETKSNSYGIWCPLTDVNKFNGCLQLVKGSHKLNSKPRGLASAHDFPYENLLSLIRKEYLTDIPMSVGQALIYDVRMFHSSPANKTTKERVAIIGQLIPKDSIMRYYHWDLQNNKYLEIFEVDDEFYTQVILGVKPEGLTSLGFIDREFEPLNAEDLASKLNNEVI